MTTSPLSSSAIEFTVTLRIPASRPVAFYMATTLRAVFASARTWRWREHQRRALARLDDRLLNDIGMTAPMRARECAKFFWQA